MFERYTEKARRAIFFARYEASEYGSPYIETEHLLLGIIRENRALLRLIPGMQPESVRKEVEDRTPIREKTATSVDIPLSNECKRVLAYAAEEAERLASQPITPAHLLLGLMREKETTAARILTQAGASIADLRRSVSTLVETEEVVRIHGRTLPLSIIQSRLEYAKRFLWKKQKFVALNIVVRRTDGLISFDLGKSETQPEFQLVKDGWKETACEICMWVFAESDNSEESIGYTNGRNWICTECHDKILSRNE